MAAYYNEIDAYAAQWLRNLIAAGHIAPGDVDERSITDVRPDDLAGYTQCHFFAGIGGWSLAARLAGFPYDRALWTGSCPCQPFSVAGKGEGKADERHLWPVFFALIRSCRPDVVMGEQVAAAVGKDWLDGVHSDLESIGYACGAAVVPACAVDAPHRRDRLWFVADANVTERRPVDSMRGRVAREHAVPQRQEAADRSGARSEAVALAHADGISGQVHKDAGRSGAGWLAGADGKARRVGSDFRRLADGLPAGMAGLCAVGFAEALEEVITHGQASSSRPAEVLRAVWVRVLSEPAPYEAMGEQAGVSQAEILLAYVRELHGRCQEAYLPPPSEEEYRASVRSVRQHTGPARTSRGRHHRKQRAEEYPDALQALSWVLAQHAEKAWSSYRSENAQTLELLAHGVPARVAKLRALGNAIVPQVAAEVIGAYLDTYGEAA